MEDEVPTLVLMPGLDGTALLFERFVSALPPNIRTHIIEYPRGEMPLEEYAAVVAGGLPAGRVVLLAESFSGIVALYLLRKHHVLVESVIFIASFGSAPHRYLLQVLLSLSPALARSIPLIPSAAWRFFCLGARASAADIAWLKGVLAQVNPSVLAHRLKLVASAEIADGPRIDVPAYYLQAEGDRLVPRSAAEYLRRLFSHFALLRVPGPHFLLQVSPTECAQLIAGIVLDAPTKAL
jgi:pimeloyl-[acyl-carrier protein] methyl ester esterase